VSAEIWKREEGEKERGGREKKAIRIPKEI